MLFRTEVRDGVILMSSGLSCCDFSVREEEGRIEEEVKGEAETVDGNVEVDEEVAEVAAG